MLTKTIRDKRVDELGHARRNEKAGKGRTAPLVGDHSRSRREDCLTDGHTHSRATLMNQDTSMQDLLPKASIYSS